MKLRKSVGTFALVIVSGSLVLAQQPKNESAPIYHVTVVERTIKAVNYQYRNGPTFIDFRGTVLLSKGKGEASVESRQGRTEIEAHLEHLTPPQQFGREYLTYVLWAISPEGRPHNLGEIVPGNSEKASLRVTTDLQAFAMIITAEPYSAVRQPSDVVVMENQVRPDTAGSTESVNAKYELLPRGQYTWHVSDSLSAEVANAPKVSAKEYDALLELYQAENAVGIAGAAHAERYAPGTYERALQLLKEAQQYHASKAEYRLVVEDAREAAQTAEDARLIAVQRQQQDDLNAARTDLSKAQADAASAQQAAQEAQARADAEVQKARDEVQAAQAQAAAAQAQAQAAQQQAQAALTASVRTEPQASVQSPRDNGAAQASAMRVSVLEDLNRALPARDTPRGLVATIPDSGFSGDALRVGATEEVSRVAAIVARHPGLSVRVEGYTDSGAALSQRRADAVRAALVSHGLSTGSVSAAGLGDSRPLASKDTPQGREENSRVEIVISGNAIGTVPFWDRSYSLTSGTR
jgi:outer membrane protein OmpA-like peptidoglycan-associated protein